MAVFPSRDIDTDWPWNVLPILPLPTSFGPCCFQIVPIRANTQTAPTLPLSHRPPMMTVFPSPDSATEVPCSTYALVFRAAPVPTNFDPCWVQVLPLRVNTQAAPKKVLSFIPPRMAVLPSSDSATEPPTIEIGR